MTRRRDRVVIVETCCCDPLRDGERGSSLRQNRKRVGRKSRATRLVMKEDNRKRRCHEMTEVHRVSTAKSNRRRSPLARRCRRLCPPAAAPGRLGSQVRAATAASICLSIFNNR